MEHGFKATTTLHGVHQVVRSDVAKVKALINYYLKRPGCRRPEPITVYVWADDGRTIESEITIIPTDARQTQNYLARVEGTVRGVKVSAYLATDPAYVNSGTVRAIAE